MLKSGILAVGLFLAGASVAAAQTLDFSGGFAPSTGLQANNNASFVNTGAATVARLTPGANDQRGSVFSTAQLDVTRFNTSFRIQFGNGTSGLADGTCFVIQRVGPAAIGTQGNGLGYEGIATSVAVKFDVYPTLGNAYTGIYQNGAVPGGAPETVISPTINFSSFQVFQVDMTYDAVDLVVTITQVGTPANTVTNTYPVDIPAVIGGTLAHVGFTAGTGGQNAVQDILTWTFATVYPVPAPTGLSATDNQQNQIVITWNAVPNAVSYQVFTGPAANGPWTPLAVVNAPTTTYTHTVVGTYFYTVQATTALGTSGNSNVDQGTSFAPPRTNGHTEGLFDDKCACGSSVAAGPGFAALAALLLLAAFRRR